MSLNKCDLVYDVGNLCASPPDFSSTSALVPEIHFLCTSVHDITLSPCDCNPNLD